MSALRSRHHYGARNPLAPYRSPGRAVAAIAAVFLSAAPFCSLAPGRGGRRPRWGRQPPLSRPRRFFAWLLGGVDAAPVGGAHHPLVACAVGRVLAPCPFGLAGRMPPLAQTATTPFCSLAPGRGGRRPRWGRQPPLSRLRRVFAFPQQNTRAQNAPSLSGRTAPLHRRGLTPAPHARAYVMQKSAACNSLLSAPGV